MKLETLDSVEQEVKRFLKRLKAAKERIKNDDYAVYGCKETGALKRACIDLKNELTTITSSKSANNNEKNITTIRDCAIPSIWVALFL